MAEIMLKNFADDQAMGKSFSDFADGTRYAAAEMLRMIGDVKTIEEARAMAGMPIGDVGELGVL